MALFYSALDQSHFLFICLVTEVVILWVFEFLKFIDFDLHFVIHFFQQINSLT